MPYQDTWLNGQVVKKGYRECGQRYGIVREFCGRYEGRPFSVCDVGANMCYFGLRLTEDFPECSVMAFEFDHFELRAAHVKANKATRLLLLEKKLGLVDFRVLSACCRFDVVLALSVIHHLGHVGKASCGEWIEALRGLGDNLLVEFALADSGRTAGLREYAIPSDGTVLGHGDSHLQRGILRPVVHLPGRRAR